MDLKKLMTVKNYASENQVTTTCVYRWIDKNIVKAVEVDGVKFIVKEPGTKPSSRN
jgi:predicted site-specific integrase-resolvase